MFTDFTPKKPIIFECKKCAFISSNKKDYTRHLSTAKHKKFTEFTHFTPKNPTAFICDKCNKHYKSRMGLWKHKQKCIIEDKETITLLQEYEEPILPRGNENTISNMMELIKQNQEFKELIVEQNQKILEFVKEDKNVTINNTNSNNRQFNLNIFFKK